MKKVDLISAIALKTGLPKVEVSEMIEAEMEIISNTMAAGENVYLRGFGTFLVKTRAEKLARNIKANTTVVVPEHKIPAFKASPEFINKFK